MTLAGQSVCPVTSVVLVSIGAPTYWCRVSWVSSPTTVLRSDFLLRPATCSFGWPMVLTAAYLYTSSFPQFQSCTGPTKPAFILLLTNNSLSQAHLTNLNKSMQNTKRCKYLIYSTFVLSFSVVIAGDVSL